MSCHLAAIWRYPIKGLGMEPLEATTLSAHAPLPGDRAFALLHKDAEDINDWQPRRNFLVVASGPRLAQIRAETREDGRLTLSHPDLAALVFDPRTEGARLIDWVRSLWPETRPAPIRLVQSPPQGMADNGQAQVSLLNRASLRAFSQHAGAELQIERFRGNLILDGLAPWEEFDLVGRELRIGQVRLRVTDRIERCRATEASPETGTRDVNTLRVLDDKMGHRDFGVYATVIQGGEITTGALVTLQ